MDEPRGCRALVVEDDEASRFVLKKLLERLGFTVCAVATLADANAQLDGQDVVLLDLNLPDGVGTSLLRRIRRERRPAKVVITSASSHPAIIEQTAQLGPDVFLPKPIDFSMLVRWLETEGLVRQPPQRGP